jgi:hypothetical protein
MWKLFASITTDVNGVSELSVLFHTEVPDCLYTAYCSYLSWEPWGFYEFTLTTKEIKTKKKKKTELRSLSLRVNYTDRATAADKHGPPVALVGNVQYAWWKV